MPLSLLPTSLVGCYPQPDWLIDRAGLAGRFPPRVRAKELWRVAPDWLEQAQDDATLLAIRDQERRGLDIITDGEMRRESYSNRFATALDGVDIDNPGHRARPLRAPQPGAAHRRHDLAAASSRGARRGIPPGQYRPHDQDDRARPVHDGAAGAERLLSRRRGVALDYAAAVNDEIKDLFAAGADIVQVDEPYLQARPERRGEFGVKALMRALDGISGTTAVHICFGYAAIIHERPCGYSFLPELGELGCGRCRSRPRSRTSTARCWPGCRRRRSSSGCSIFRHDGRERRERSRRDPPGAADTCQPIRSWSRQTAA